MKKFWRIFKKVMVMISALSFAALFIIVFTSAVQKQNTLKCNGVKVKIDYDSGLAFLGEQEIKNRVNYLCGGKAKGKTISRIDFRNLEHELSKNPYIDNAQVFVDGRQHIVINVTQKRPVLRILNSDGVGYYLSEKNERIPLSDNFTAHVAIALGSVEMHREPKRDSAVQAALFHLIQFVRKDEVLDALVDQVYVNDNAELDIYTKIPGHFVRFGNVDDKMAEKFDKLKIFYKEGMCKVGWNKYKSIDLRFDNQVVCVKRDTTKSI